ncbi:MAG: 3-oxoacyl-[acyl-carrier-protein] reductase [Verrucomicrobiales bacterium]
MSEKPLALQDRVAIVTGAGRGIGRAIALRFAAAGAKVAAVSRTEANAASAADEINAAHPGAAKAYAVDVADPEAVNALAKAVAGDLGGADILVNNAGVTRDGLSMRMSDADWDLVLNTNLKGAFHACRAFQRALLKSPHGRIINISSVIGLIGNPGQANYAASKAGLIGLTKSLAREFARRGVTANAIAPGFIETDMTSELNEDLRETVLKGVPLGKFGSADDIAATAEFLAGDGARYITGQTLVVDGGMVM